MNKRVYKSPDLEESVGIASELLESSLAGGVETTDLVEETLEW